MAADHIDIKNINWQNITPMSDNLAVKPPDYFSATKWSEVYDSGPHIVYLNFPHRSGMHGHNNWSTAMQMSG